MSKVALTALLIACFAIGAVATGLLLSGLGLYALVSWLVSQRVREIGIRLAIGATPRNVRRLVAADGVRLGAIGTGVGIILAAGLMIPLTGWVLGPMLGVDPPGPVVYAGAAAVSLLAATVFAYIPGHRASRVDPVEALRAE
jgi:ABC-type antimicrobial peptide transport system permease subunit